MQGQKFVTKCENPFGFSQWNFARSMDSRHITLYDKLKYLRESFQILAILLTRIFARMDSRILAKFLTLQCQMLTYIIHKPRRQAALEVRELQFFFQV